MATETPKLGLPRPEDHDNVTRENHIELIDAIDENAASQSELDAVKGTAESHAGRHASGGADEITPAMIGAETPSGAQTKADDAEDSAKQHADNKMAELAGVGRTTETVKGNADALTAHLDDYAQLVTTKVIDSSGSNNDGEWIRFADGTQICWYQHDWSYNHTENELKTDTWTFPMPFAQVSSVSATLANRVVGESGGANQANAIVSASRRSSSSMSLTDCDIFCRPLFTHSNSYVYSTLIALGRWKL